MENTYFKAQRFGTWRQTVQCNYYKSAKAFPNATMQVANKLWLRISFGKPISPPNFDQSCIRKRFPSKQWKQDIFTQ